MKILDMTKKIYILSIILILFTLFKAEAKEKYYIKMANSEMVRNPESWMIDFSDIPKWNYTHGLELQAFLGVYNKTGISKYYDYVYSFADLMVNCDGVIKTYNSKSYSLDMINAGNILFEIYDKTKNPKYKKAMELLRNQFKEQPRVANGGFWHKLRYPGQVWLDGIYMALPFMVHYASEFKEPKLYDDAASQIINAYHDLVDEKTGLLYHGWDESKTQIWADPKTGRSPNFWSRSIGWYMMALVDVLDYLPENHPQRPEIIKILNDLSVALENFRDEKSGMWYQVIDKGSKKGNYLESSGSIMFIYTWIKGAQKGYLSKPFLKKGKKAYQQFLKEFIIKNADGTISITNVCAVAGLDTAPNKRRDGSFNYYISEPVRNNDPKAVGPFMMTSILLNK